MGHEREWPARSLAGGRAIVSWMTFTSVTSYLVDKLALTSVPLKEFLQSLFGIRLHVTRFPMLNIYLSVTVLQRIFDFVGSYVANYATSNLLV